MTAAASTSALSPPDRERLTLRSPEVEVILLPAAGANIYAFVDIDSGIDVLFKTPWGWRDPDAVPPYTDSRSNWLARCPGGWDVLIPHAGPAAPRGGTVHGFHGEAALLRWAVEEQTPTAAILSVELFTAPLRLTRRVGVDGAQLTVTDTIENLSPHPCEYAWVQHPVFGAPFLDGRCTLDAAASTLIADTEAPGTLLGAGAVLGFPTVPALDGTEHDLRRVPGPDEVREVFGALTDFTAGWFSIMSPSAGFGVRLEWDPGVYPHAWFWQECHATHSFPWFGRAYALAVEPANLLPGVGAVGRWERGRASPLGGSARVTTTMRLSRVPLSSPPSSR